MLDIDLFLESAPRTRVARSPTVVIKKDDILLDTPPKPKVFHYIDKTELDELNELQLFE